jgi:hypothetical protein
MIRSDLGRICARRAGLLRELADLEAELGRALEAAEPELADAVLSLPEAASYMGEPVSTFRRRPDYLRALVSKPTERRRRYSRVELERIKRGRLEAAAVLSQVL